MKKSIKLRLLPYIIAMIILVITFFTATFTIPNEIWAFDVFINTHIINISIIPRKYLLLFIIFLIFSSFLFLKKVYIVKCSILNLLYIWLIYMFAMILFTKDEYLLLSISNAFGYLFSILFLIILLQLSNKKLLILLKINFILLLFFTIITNYMLPPNLMSYVYRYGGLYNPNAYAIYMSYGIILSFLMLKKHHIIQNTIILIIVFYFIYNLSLTLSRSSMLMLIFAFFIINIISISYKKKISYLFIFILLVLGLLSYAQTFGIDMYRVGGLSARLNGSLLYPLSYAIDNLLLPYGYGINILMGTNGEQLDNSYLYFLLIGGIFSLVLIVIVYLLLIKIIFIVNNRNNDIVLKVISVLLLYKIFHSVLEGSHKLMSSWTDLIFFVALIYIIKIYKIGAVDAKANILN